MLKVLTAVFILCFFLAGYYLGAGHKREAGEALLEKVVQSAGAPPSRSLSYAVSVVTDETARSEGIVQASLSSAEKALDQVQLSEKEYLASHALGNDPVGAKIRRFLLSENHASEVPGANLISSRFLEELRQSPDAGVAVLNTGLDRIPASGMPLERAALLLAMGDLKPNDPAVRARALSELTENVIAERPAPGSAHTLEQQILAKSTTSDMALPIAAYQVFLKSSPSSEEALSGTVSGIVAQQDRVIRNALRFQFLSAFPKMQHDLDSALNAKGVEVLMEKPTLQEGSGK